jgi:streptogramin lyase
MPMIPPSRSASALVVLAAVLIGAPALLPRGSAAQAPQAATPSSADWLALLPDGEMKRRFILDCTGCHQFDELRAWKDGAPRSATQWQVDLDRMVGFAGARSGFPVISLHQETAGTPEWVAQAMAAARTRPAAAPVPAAANPGRAAVTEFDTPMPGDLPHDLAVDSASGQILVTGMFSHVMYQLNAETGALATITIPVPRANPRAVELDAVGNWWVLLGGPNMVARYEPGPGRWSTFPIGMYPHSIAVGGDGRIWFNGHFTRDPEELGFVDPASGRVERFHLPPHPELATVPGGPVPYEQRVAPDGKVWISELQGNRMICFDPATRQSRVYTLPTSFSGPRRFDIDARGILWIPAYSGNLLVRLDPATGRFTEYPIPVKDATPYIARVDPLGRGIWLAMAAADVLMRFDPATSQFTTYPLPTRGTLTRHLVVNPRNGEVWLAYGASPSVNPSRVARVRVE